MRMKCKNCGSSIVPIQEVGPGFQGKGWCAYCEGSMPSLMEIKDARIAALESALKVAEEAFGFLGEVRYFCTHCCGQEPDLAASGAMAVCKKCGYCMGRIEPKPDHVAALAAIRETHQGAKEGPL